MAPPAKPDNQDVRNGTPPEESDDHYVGKRSIGRKSIGQKAIVRNIGEEDEEEDPLAPLDCTDHALSHPMGGGVSLHLNVYERPP
eukprot:7340259-Prorocentrum_lima.AAC.1